MTDNLEKENENEAPEQDNPQEEQLDSKELRHSQQMDWARKEVEKYKSMVLDAEVQKAEQDASSLLELYKKDPKLANDVARKFWYDDFNDAKKAIYSNEEPEEKQGFTEDDIERIVSEREARKEHERALTKAERFINKIDEDLQDKAKNYFDKITEGKMLDEETALEFAEMATLYVSKDKSKEDRYSEGLANYASTWLSKTNKNATASKWPEYIVQDWRLILKSNK